MIHFNVRWLWIVAVSIILSSMVYATDINNCTILNDNSSAYFLTSDFHYNYSNSFNITQSGFPYEFCFNPTINNITLDCQGFTIYADYIYNNHNRGTVFINSSISGLTVKNCNFQGYWGVWNTLSINSSFINNNFLDNILPIKSVSSDNTTIENNTFNSGLLGLLVFQDSNNSLIINNTLSNYDYPILEYICGNTQDEKMINFISSNNNTIKNNIMTDVDLGYCPGTLYFDSNSNYNFIYNNKLLNDSSYIGTQYLNTTNQTGTKIYGNGTNIGGNYWIPFSNTCDDSNHDGFCDSTFSISGLTDYLPLSNNTYVCYPSITCGSWSSCLNSTQNRSCSDGCGINSTQNQSCIMPYSSNQSSTYCYDNQTLFTKYVYITSIDGKEYDYFSPTYCLTGCDNVSMACNPPDWQADLITAILIIGMLIIVALFAYWMVS